MSLYVILSNAFTTYTLIFYFLFSWFVQLCLISDWLERDHWRPLPLSGVDLLLSDSCEKASSYGVCIWVWCAGWADVTVLSTESACPFHSTHCGQHQRGLLPPHLPWRNQHSHAQSHWHMHRCDKSVTLNLLTSVPMCIFWFSLGLYICNNYFMA